MYTYLLRKHCIRPGGIPSFAIEVGGRTVWDSYDCRDALDRLAILRKSKPGCARYRDGKAKSIELDDTAIVMLTLMYYEKVKI